MTELHTRISSVNPVNGGVPDDKTECKQLFTSEKRHHAALIDAFRTFVTYESDMILLDNCATFNAYLTYVKSRIGIINGFNTQFMGKSSVTSVVLDIKHVDEQKVASPNRYSKGGAFHIANSLLVSGSICDYCVGVMNENKQQHAKRSMVEKLRKQLLDVVDEITTTMNTRMAELKSHESCILSLANESSQRIRNFETIVPTLMLPQLQAYSEPSVADVKQLFEYIAFVHGQCSEIDTTQRPDITNADSVCIKLYNRVMQNVHEIVPSTEAVRCACEALIKCSVFMFTTHVVKPHTVIMMAP
jgi:hypothetical protein